MRKIGIVVESNDGEIKKSALGLITAARGTSHDLYALVFDGHADIYFKDLSDCGVQNIIDIQFEADNGDLNPELWSQAVVAAVGHFGLDTLIGLSSPVGREVLPRTAARLDAPLVMDCTQIRLVDNTASKPLYSGKTIGTVRLSGSPVMFGLRPNAYRPSRAPEQAKTVTLSVAADRRPRLKVRALRRQENGVDLSEADIIVSGGRGMQNGDNYGILQACAKALGAAVGASRVAVNSGWVPHIMQVGQTGSTVNPKLYIACGISGAVQHFAGMKTSGLIVAINTNSEAPMVKHSDYAIIGDLFEIVPLLTRELNKKPVR